MTLSIEALMAVLAAINGVSELSDEEKAAVVGMVTDGFSTPPTEAEAVDAMPAGMRATYQARGEGAPTDEQREQMLEDGMEIVRRNRSAEAVRRLAAGGEGRQQNQPADSTPLTVGVLRNLLPGLIAEGQTRTMRTFGARTVPTTVTPEQRQQQEQGHADPKVRKFAAAVKKEHADGLSRGEAIQVAARKDAAGFQAWNTAGRPRE